MRRANIITAPSNAHTSHLSIIHTSPYCTSCFAVYRNFFSKKMRFSTEHLYARHISGILLARGALLPDSQLRSVTSLIPSCFDASSCVNPALVRAARIVIRIVSPLFVLRLTAIHIFIIHNPASLVNGFPQKKLRFSLIFLRFIL